MARLTKEQIAANEKQAAELRAAQQAELTRMRAAKRAANKQAKVAVAATTFRAPDLSHANIDELMSGFEMPSVKRVLVGTVLGIAAAGATGYGIGTLLAYALAGITTLTATAWIAFVLSALAWIIAIYAGWKLGGYVGGKVFASVVLPEGLAARSYASVVNAMGNAKQNAVALFSIDKDELAQQVVAKFSGAHIVQAAA
jgi:hypothetical protein